MLSIETVALFKSSSKHLVNARRNQMRCPSQLLTKAVLESIQQAAPSRTVLQAVRSQGCWVEYRQMGCRQDFCPSLPEHDKEYILKKGSAGGAPTLETRESARVDSLFSLLTVLSGKSAPERCWMAALTGCCCWEACRGQYPMYKHSGPLEPLTWHHYHSWCTCLSSAELPRRQKEKKRKEKKAACTNFNSLLFFMQQDKNTKSIHCTVAWLVLYTPVETYHPHQPNSVANRGASE